MSPSARALGYIRLASAWGLAASLVTAGATAGVGCLPKPAGVGREASSPLVGESLASPAHGTPPGRAAGDEARDPQDVPEGNDDHDAHPDSPGFGASPREAEGDQRVRGRVPTASRYAALDRAACESELARRSISFDRVVEARGVLAPVRLTGK